MEKEPQKVSQKQFQDDLADSEEVEVIRAKRNQEKSQNLEIYEYQVSGKTPKYIDNLHGFIYKKYSSSQYQFYQFLKALPQTDPRFQLKSFIPQYLGIFNEEQVEGLDGLKNSKTQVLPEQTSSKQPKQPQKNEQKHRNFWIEHISSREDLNFEEDRRFICLKNLTYNYQNPNILDLKLGRKKPKKSNLKFKDSTTESHCFRINGMVTQLHNSQDYQQYFLSKYFGQKITVAQIENYLALFFFNGKSINKALIQWVLAQLEKLIKSFKKFTGIKFISSSLFISYDADSPEHFAVKLIDFDKYEHDQSVKEDTNISQGLDNICSFLENLVLDIESHQKILINRELEIFKNDILVVPEERIEKYRPKSAIQQTQ